jgi:hypothetical protein
MHRNAYVCCLVVVSLAGIAGCSSNQAAKDSKKAAAPDRIQGKAQVNLAEANANDLALNAGGPSVYLVDGVRRYRLFFNKPVTVDAGKAYVAEGVYAQKVIDDIGDPDQGKDGYPLQASCDRVIRTAWPGLAFDVTDLHSSVLRARIKRYPARPIFLVTKLTPATSTESDGKAAGSKNVEAEEGDIPEITVPAEKQRALLVEQPTTAQQAPLWEPAATTAKCKVLIGADGKISDLETGAQLCESVTWSQFRFQPTVQKGHPVKVHSEVEVKFEPRK